MNRDQLSAAIASLLRAADDEIKQAVHAEGSVWVAHMTASKITMHLAHALMDVRDMGGYDAQTKV